MKAVAVIRRDTSRTTIKTASVASWVCRNASELVRRLPDLVALTMLKVRFSFGGLGAKLLNREERFDRVVIDKKIESREAYFKGLQKLVENTQSSEAFVAEAWEEYLKARGEAERKKVHAKFRKRENVRRSYCGKF